MPLFATFSTLLSTNAFSQVTRVNHDSAYSSTVQVNQAVLGSKLAMEPPSAAPTSPRTFTTKTRTCEITQLNGTGSIACRSSVSPPAGQLATVAQRISEHSRRSIRRSCRRSCSSIVPPTGVTPQASMAACRQNCDAAKIIDPVRASSGSSRAPPKNGAAASPLSDRRRCSRSCRTVRSFAYSSAYLSLTQPRAARRHHSCPASLRLRRAVLAVAPAAYVGLSLRAISHFRVL
jgi:hypothetical protein